MARIAIGNHLVIDPQICHGQITFKSTRIPVDTVLTFLAKGYTVDQILRSWPELTQPAVAEAITLHEGFQLEDIDWALQQRETQPA
jgi:uncharacterized protein (DUF433 family)